MAENFSIAQIGNSFLKVESTESNIPIFPVGQDDASDDDEDDDTFDAYGPRPDGPRIQDSRKRSPGRNTGGKKSTRRDDRRNNRNNKYDDRRGNRKDGMFNTFLIN